MGQYNYHNIYPDLSTTLPNDQQFRLNKINEIKDYFIAEIKERELMSKRLSKHIASFDYFDKSLIVLSVATDSISIASFATVVGAPVGMMNASCSFAFSVTTEFVKKNLKTATSKKKKHNKIVMLARSKLNSIERKISEALINNEISHEDFMIILNEQTKFREVKESIRMMNSQRRNVAKVSLIEEGKKDRYCLKCKKDTETINLRFSNRTNSRTMILSKCATCGSKKSRFVKNQEEKGLLSNLGVTYGACGPFTKNKERTQKIK